MVLCTAASQERSRKSSAADVLSHNGVNSIDRTFRPCPLCTNAVDAARRDPLPTVAPTSPQRQKPPQPSKPHTSNTKCDRAEPLPALTGFRSGVQESDLCLLFRSIISPAFSNALTGSKSWSSADLKNANSWVRQSGRSAWVTCWGAAPT